MPVIENRGQKPFEFPRAPNDSAVIRFAPAFGPTNPSRTTVTDEQLDRMRKHPASKAWFGPGALSVWTPPAPVADDKTEPSK